MKYALAAIKFELLRTCRVAQFGDCTPHGAMSLFLHTVMQMVAVRRERGDIDQGTDACGSAGLGDHRAAPGVADQNDGA